MNSPLKYLSYGYSLEAAQQADIAKNIQPEEIKEEPTQIVENKEDANVPQVDNKPALLNIYRASGMRI